VSEPYDRSYYPPAPVVEVQLGPPGEPFALGPIRALVDTGADACVLPSQIVERLGLPVDSQQYLSSPGGVRQHADVYILDVGIAGVRIPGIEVAAVDSYLDAIIGRIVLNKLTIVLDGPRQMFELRA
jgi:predicted aspartyl protease